MIQVWVLFYLLPMMGNHSTYETKECCERNLVVGSYCEVAYIKRQPSGVASARQQGQIPYEF